MSRADDERLDAEKHPDERMESDHELSDEELEQAAGGDDGWGGGTQPPPGGGG